MEARIFRNGKRLRIALFFPFLWVAVSCFHSSMLTAQTMLSAEETMETKVQSLSITAMDASFQLDGIPDEPFWAQAAAADNFWMKQPLVKPDASPGTIVKVAYDAQNLYLAAWCYEEAPVIVKTLRRDSDFWRGDGIGVVLDPVNQHTFAYFFGVSPYGTQADGIILGVNQSVQTEWDGRFYSATQQYETHWTAEMVIPLKSLRFNPDQKVWGINFIRNNFNQNETHTWVPIPLQFTNTDINYTGQLVWDMPPRQVSSNVALIPYLLGGYQKEPRSDKPVRSLLESGLDARIGLGSALNLDLTFNPDFSQAEIDEQPVNLTRFNILLPERRTFFLENRDVFTQFGTGEIQPFFSRRIGLNDSGQAVPILGGARLTGNLNENTRIGVMSMQTEGTASTVSHNYSAVAIHQRVLKRSIVRALVTNTQGFPKEQQWQKDYSRNAGLEGIFISEDGTLRAWSLYHHSFHPGVDRKNGMYGAGASYSERNFSASIQGSGAGENFFADMGFTPRLNNYDASRDTTIRLGFHKLYSDFTISTYPEGKSLFNRHWLEGNATVYLNPDGSFNDATQRLNYSFFFRDRRFLRFYSQFEQVDLLFPTRFVRGAQPLDPGYYQFLKGGIFFDTDSRRPWYFLNSFEAGDFYNGQILSAETRCTYRVQPYGSISVGATWNSINLPSEFGEADILNITTRLDLTFSNHVFWTSFFQYNTQQQIFNINSRIQWRFAPLSDLFIVYTDSYDTPGGVLNDRSRTLLIKLNYWWNL